MTLFFGLLMVVISQWLGRITRRMAGHLVEAEAAAETNSIPPSDAQPVSLTSLAAWKARLAKAQTFAALTVYLAGLSAVWLGGSLLMTNWIWKVPVEWTIVLSWATHPLFVVGEQGISMWSLAQVVLWIIASVYTGRLVQGFVVELLEHFAVDRGLRDTMSTLTRYVTIVAGIALGLSSVGIGLGAMAMFFGVIGIGLGLGLQSIASNLFSGFVILLERPVRKGDFIQVGDMVGEVKDISVRSTTLETRDAVTVIVPNSELVGDKVINWTLGRDERMRTQVVVGVAYGSDVRLVRRALLAVARAHPGVLKYPRPWVEMTSFGDSSLDFKLHVWTRRIRTLPALVSDLNMAVDQAFREHGIEIPFPQRDLHIRRDDEEAATVEVPPPESRPKAAVKPTPVPLGLRRRVRLVPKGPRPRLTTGKPARQDPVNPDREES